jgi:hypothetical protein
MRKPSSPCTWAVNVWRELSLGGREHYIAGERPHGSLWSEVVLELPGDDLLVDIKMRDPVLVHCQGRGRASGGHISHQRRQLGGNAWGRPEEDEKKQEVGPSLRDLYHRVGALIRSLLESDGVLNGGSVRTRLRAALLRTPHTRKLPPNSSLPLSLSYISQGNTLSESLPTAPCSGAHPFPGETLSPC